MSAWLLTASFLIVQSQIDDPSRFNNYLLLGYVVMWIVAIAYLANLANKQRNLQQDIRLMRRLLEEEENGS